MIPHNEVSCVVKLIESRIIGPRSWGKGKMESCLMSIRVSILQDDNSGVGGITTCRRILSSGFKTW